MMDNISLSSHCQGGMLVDLTHSRIVAVFITLVLQNYLLQSTAVEVNVLLKEIPFCTLFSGPQPIAPEPWEDCE